MLVKMMAQAITRVLMIKMEKMAIKVMVTKQRSRMSRQMRIRRNVLTRK